MMNLLEFLNNLRYLLLFVVLIKKYPKEHFRYILYVFYKVSSLISFFILWLSFTIKNNLEFSDLF